MARVIAQAYATITKLYEGVQVKLTNQLAAIPCDSTGAEMDNSYIGASTTVEVYIGANKLEDRKIVLGELIKSGTMVAEAQGTTVSIKKVYDATGYVDIPVGIKLDDEKNPRPVGTYRFNYIKQYQGGTGGTGPVGPAGPQGPDGNDGAEGVSYTLNITGGSRGIAYAANGTSPEPTFENSLPFKVQLFKNDEEVTEPSNIAWSAGGNFSGSLIGNSGFKPFISNTYSETSTFVKVSVRATPDSPIINQTIPIICTKHADGLDWINEWNAAEGVSIGDDKIISPRIFAGTGNSSGNLTGVAIGRDVVGGNANNIVGIVGYKNSIPVFSLDQNANFLMSTGGTAGEVEKGKINGIYFDGKDLSITGKVSIKNGSTIGDSDTDIKDIITGAEAGSDAKEKIDGMDIGGTNLLPKESLYVKSGSTGEFNGTTNTWTIVAAPKSDSWGRGLTIHSNSEILIPFGKGATYSFEIKVPKPISWNTDVNNAKVGISNSSNDNDMSSKRKTSKKTITKVGEWVKCWSYVENSDLVKNPTKADLKDVNSFFGIVTTAETDSITFQIRNFKVELGNVATAWSPCPKDTDKTMAKMVKTVSLEYGLSKSSSNPPSTWSTKAPEWEDGLFMWSRTRTEFIDSTIKPVISNETCISGAKGDTGTPGTDGTDGKTTYFHIKYSAIANPTKYEHMTETPSTYIGTYVDYTSTDSTNPAAYTWSRFEGQQGPKGTDGLPGVGIDGKTTYLHIKYSNDGVSFTSNNGEDPGEWIGQYTDFTVADSNNFSTYKWSKIKGTDGNLGGEGRGIESVTAEYYVSTSKTTPTGGTWSTQTPVWSPGKYVWTRNKIVYRKREQIGNKNLATGTSNAYTDVATSSFYKPIYSTTSNTGLGITTGTKVTLRIKLAPKSYTVADADNLKPAVKHSGYLNNSGGVVSGGWYYTDYIPVNPGAKYTINGFRNLGTSPSTCFYDSSKTFISGIANGNSGNYSHLTNNCELFETPVNAKFMRCSYSADDDATIKIGIAHGMRARVSPYRDEDRTDYASFFGNIIRCGEEGYSTVTFTYPSTANKGFFSGVANAGGRNGSNCVGKYAEYKLETGSQATPWCPHTSDAADIEYTVPMCDSSWEAVNELEIGGVNLVMNSGEFKNLEHWTNYPGNGKIMHSNLLNTPIILIENVSTNKEVMFGTESFSLSPNTEYTFGGTMNVSTSCTGADIHLLCKNKDSSNNYDVSYSITGITGSSYKRYKRTITTGPNVVSGYIRLDNNSAKTAESKANVFVQNVSVVKGNTFPEWSPSPKDLQEQITAVDKSLEYSNNLLTTGKINWDKAFSSVNSWSNGGFTEIDGGKITTNSIISSKIAVGDFTNYASWSGKKFDIHYPFNGGAYDSSTFNRSVASVKVPPKNYVHLKKRIGVTPGETIYFEVYYKTTSDFNGSSNMSKFRFGDQSGAHLKSNHYSRNTEWTKLSDKLVVPAGVTDLTIQVAGHDGDTGTLWIDDVIIKKMYTGELIVDGSITTAKINAQGLDAAVIKAGTISADRLDANSIVSKVNGASTTISGNKITTGTIDATKLVVSSSATAGEGNLAFGRTTSGTASSSEPTNGTKAIGSTYTSFSSGNGTNNAAEGPYLQIDLGSTRMIGESRIYWYSGDVRGYWYKIKYSTDGTTWHYAVGRSGNSGWVLSPKPVSPKSGDENPTVDTFPISISARYLRIYGNGNTVNTSNHIYEWELYSKSSTQISGKQIITGSITADKLTVADISAVSARIGGWEIASDRIKKANMPSGSEVYLYHGGTDLNSSVIMVKKENDVKFSVNNSGRVVAKDAVITGSITSSTGTIGGFTIGADKLTGSGVGIGSKNSSYAFWAGSNSGATAPFRVTHAGAFVFGAGDGTSISNGTSTGIYFNGSSLFVSGKIHLNGDSTLGNSKIDVDTIISGADAGTKANNAQIGTHNIIMNSANFVNKDHWTYNPANLAVFTSGALKAQAMHIRNTSANQNYAGTKKYKLSPNTTYTMSALINVHANCKSAQMYFLTSNSDSLSGSNYDEIAGVLTITTKSKYLRFTKTFTTSSTAQTGYFRIDNDGCVEGATDSHVYFTEVMVVKGDKAGVWTQCPDEITQEVTTVKKTVSDMSVTQGQISSKVSTLETSSTRLMNESNQNKANTRCNNTGMKINFSTFTRYDEGEVYLHGYDSKGAPTDTDGTVYWNGKLVTIKKGMINPNGDFGTRELYICCSPTAGGNVYLAYFNESDNKWYFKYVIGASNEGELNLVTTPGFVIGQIKMASAEAITHAYMYASPIRLESVAGISYTEKRLAIAETKITDTAITNTVKKSFYTKDEVNSKEYQTSSQVSQTVNALEVKFDSSGGYNLLRNTTFPNRDYSHWYTWGPVERYHNADYFKEIGQMWLQNSNTSSHGGFWQRLDCSIKPNTKYTLSVIASKESNVRGGNFSIEYTESIGSGTPIVSQSVDLIYDGKRHAYTFTSPNDSRINSAQCGFKHYGTVNSSGSYLIQIVKPCLAEGEMAMWSPHPSEIYSGITTIDEKGIQVNHSSVSSSTRMKADGFYILDSDGDTIASLSSKDSWTELKANKIYTDNIERLYEGETNIAVNYGYSGISTGSTTYPFKSLNELKEYFETKGNIINKTVNVTVVVVSSDGLANDSFTLRNIKGSGTLNFKFVANVAYKYKIPFKLYNIGVPVNIEGGSNTSRAMMIGPGGSDNDTFVFEDCTRVVVKYFNADGKSSGCFFSYQNSCGAIYNCDAVGYTRFLESQYGSRVYVRDCRGNSLTNSLVAHTASIAGAYGTIPNASISEGYGGVVKLHSTTPTNSSFSAPTVPSTSVQNKSFNMTSFSTYQYKWNNWSGGECKQGTYSTYGNKSGHMFFDIGGLRSFLSGTVQEGNTITLTRATSGGTSLDTNVYICGSNRTSGSETPTHYDSTKLGTLKWGETKTFTLPKTIVDKLKTGTASSLACYSSSDTGAYVRITKASINVKTRK